MFYVFHHIPKTAGQSCADIFGKFFNVIPDYHQGTDAESLERYSLNKVELSKLDDSDLLWGHYNIPGHYLYQRYPLLDHFDARKIIFFRDPLATAISGIKYGVKMGWYETENAAKILMDRAGYFFKMLQCDVNNYRDVIDSYFFVGLVESIQESIDALARMLGEDSCSIGRKNSTDDMDDVLLEPEVIDDFRSRNWLDFEIYEYAKMRANLIMERANRYLNP